MSSILGKVTKNRMLSIRSSTDRFPCRKFSTSKEGIAEKFSSMLEVDEDSIYLLEKVLQCYDIHATYGSNKFDRYTSSMKKDVYYLPTLLGLNESIKECHQKYVGVYDMSKLHTVILSVLVGESPQAITGRLTEYLDSLDIHFSEYLNYIINGVASNIFKKGFRMFDLINSISNSYLNIKRYADSHKLSVEEFVRAYIVKYNEVLFNEFMNWMEEKSKSVLVQSVGLDTLVISAPNVSEFEPLTFEVYKNSYTLEPEVFDVNDFNTEIPNYYLNRRLMNVC